MEGSREAMFSALFAQLVVQQANMAMMLLGKMAHPETGKVMKDIEAARLFIDQLEMLEVKTKGNLTKEESTLLKQSLMSLRLGFVEAVDSPKSQTPTEPKEALKTETPQTETPTAEREEHRKKFSKKY
jgi:hypothetical protein